jgi:hypothetical protein
MLNVETLGSATDTPCPHAHAATLYDIYRSFFLYFFQRLKLCRTFRMSATLAVKRNANEP